MADRLSVKKLAYGLSQAAKLGCVVATLAGCIDSKPTGVRLPEVDPAAAAGRTLELYDADKNGALEADELAACPPLAAAVGAYDADKNGALASEEISERFARLYGAGSALSNISCQVTLAGRPLSGATVKFCPVAMLSDEIQPAEGVTDDSGVARPAISADKLPENLKSSPLVQPGLYHVEITHPQQSIPARYNTETELGFEVDPMSRGGLAPSFRLK